MLLTATKQEPLQNDRFELFVQAIEPCRHDLDQPSLYEVFAQSLVPNSGFVRVPPLASVTSDRWVVSNVFDWLDRYGHGADNIRLAVNLCFDSVCDSAFLDFVRARCNSSLHDPVPLIFQISENAAVRDLSATLYFIKQLTETGILFALNEYGSGLSSFRQLKHLPVDFLKLDRCLLKNLLKDCTDQAIVRSVADIGHSMNKWTAAVNVDSDLVKQRLKQLGIDFVQGLSIARAQPIKQLRPIPARLS